MRPSRADLATLVLLLDRGAEVNAPQSRLMTPLHGAAATGQVAAAAVLLLYGADAGARNDAGETAAELARAEGFAALAERLAGRQGQRPR
jgi:Arf-GAP/coiled-coil/ANK repeat/PH domain-containing protein